MPMKTIYLVRHGQYDPEGEAEDGLGGGLSLAGMTQAKLTAKRLSVYPITTMHSSSLTRAVQTAKIIAEEHPNLLVKESDILWELTPPVPYLIMKYVKEISSEKMAAEERKAEKAFQTYFKPAEGENDEYEIIVCHGNIIRYFICRVLKVSVLAWLNFETYNCSINSVEIDEFGNMKLLSYNESGHLPEELKTQNLTSMGVGV
ncbi:MAG: histidine phosphatase family protein [Anaerolineaceae bacterium]|nr:histidine phosphatase family protein [Anaerolineaceae bacterium]